MNDPTVGALSGIYLIIVLFLVVLAILWFFLPFAIFGTKAKLDSLISEMRKSNAEFKRLREQLATGSTQVSPESSGPPQELRLTHDQIMAKYGISNDGEKYIFQGHRYDRLEDAAAYARKQTST